MSDIEHNLADSRKSSGGRAMYYGRSRSMYYGGGSPAAYYPGGAGGYGSGYYYGGGVGGWMAVGGFFAGMALIATIDKRVPEPENPHDAFLQQDAKGPPCKSGEDSRLLRLGMMTALTIGIHNFPEGMATFFAAMSDPARGASVALAIAIHNNPEGIVVAIPVYYATGNKR